MIRDYDNILQRNTFENYSNVAIMLYPQHEPSDDKPDVAILPDIKKLKKMRIKEFIILDEFEFSGKEHQLNDRRWDNKFLIYFDILKKRGH